MLSMLARLLGARAKPFGEMPATTPFVPNGLRLVGLGLAAFGAALLVATLLVAFVDGELEAAFSCVVFRPGCLSQNARGEIVSAVEITLLALFAIAFTRLFVTNDLRHLYPYDRPRLDKLVLGLATAMLAIDLLVDLGIQRLVGQEVPPWVQTPTSRDATLFFVFATVVAAPIGEEVLFRGLIQGTVRASLGVPASLIIPTVIFALIHYDGSILQPLLLLPGSFCLALARELSGSLTPPTLIHIIGNGVATTGALLSG